MLRGLPASDDDLRNTRWARFDQKKTQDNESFRVRGGEYVTPPMFTLPVKVSPAFKARRRFRTQSRP